MARHRRISVWLMVLVVGASLPAAAAEQKKLPPKSEGTRGSPQQTQPAAAAPQPQGPALPDAFKLNLLIRSSIVALNQANQTGNYTVLQDLAAPAFRASNNSARLAQIFEALRKRQLDLTPVLFFTPKLVAQPQIAPNGLLRLTGYFPTAPERVNFDLIYQPIEGQWRLFGIGVNTSPADVTSAVPQSGGEPSTGAPASQAAQTAPAAPPASDDSAAHDGQSTSKAVQKPDVAPYPSHKPQTENRSGPKRRAAAAKEPGVQNGTTNTAARIDLAKPDAAGVGEAAQDVTNPDTESAPKQQPSLWNSLNIFGSD